ncbi:cation:proton antiporter [Polymorphospora sp. NPDC051019]|uniref:cation:proton antiporter n=1 Tax=Polymorphospora sp. NPDC051019 TaxID=3155725 RepID=UPI00341E0E43
MQLSAAIAPPIAPHALLVLLLQVAVLLLGAVLMGRLAARLGLAPVVGELTTGLILGPSLLGALAPGVTGWLLPADATQAHLLDGIAQLGVLLLVGVTGLHLDAAMLRRRAGAAFPVSLTGIVIPLGMGVGLGYLLPPSMLGDNGQRGVFALFIGVAMGVSAIPVIAKVLSDLRLLHRDVSQLTLTAAAIDDTIAWLLLSIVSAAVTAGVAFGQLTGSIVLTLLVPVAALLLRPLVAVVLRRAARSAEPATAGAVVVVVILLAAAGTHALGLEAVLGAFAAGILVGTSGVPKTLLAPLRTVVIGVFAPLFLATVGLRMDLTALVRPEVALSAVVVTAVAIVGKFAGAYAGARISRLGHWEGLALGAGMNARGAVEAVVAMVGLRLGVLNTASYTVIIVVAIVTSLMAPPLVRWAMARVPMTSAERDRQVADAAWMTSAVSADISAAPAVGGATGEGAGPVAPGRADAKSGHRESHGGTS